MEIWINPACSKCRTATKALDEAGIAYTVRRYLDDPPTPEELTAVLARLHLEPWDLVRHNEPAAKPLRTLPRDEAHRADWIQAMADNPILIQRPILTADDNTTAVARDPETSPASSSTRVRVSIPCVLRGTRRAHRRVGGRGTENPTPSLALRLALHSAEHLLATAGN